MQVKCLRWCSFFCIFSPVLIPQRLTRLVRYTYLNFPIVITSYSFFLDEYQLVYGHVLAQKVSTRNLSTPASDVAVAVKVNNYAEFLISAEREDLYCMHAHIADS